MRPYLNSAVGTALLLMIGMGCSSTTVVPEQPLIPEVPEYVRVPHPVNFELASLRAIFFSPLAPENVKGEFSKTCDQDFQKLAELTNSIEEKNKAAVELVSGDPERMHWCFYGKISKLQESLQDDSTWSERQKKVFETFTFLAPTANAFLEVYHDSRYLRWATQYYSRISEWVFFRKVTPGPESSLAIIHGAGSSNLEPWIPVDTKTSKRDSVFTKYGISLAPTVAAAMSPIENPPVREPASKAAEVKPEEKKVEETASPELIPSDKDLKTSEPNLD